MTRCQLSPKLLMFRGYFLQHPELMEKKYCSPVSLEILGDTQGQLQPWVPHPLNWFILQVTRLFFRGSCSFLHHTPLPYQKHPNPLLPNVLLPRYTNQRLDQCFQRRDCKMAFPTIRNLILDSPILKSPRNLSSTTIRAVSRFQACFGLPIAFPVFSLLLPALLHLHSPAIHCKFSLASRRVSLFSLFRHTTVWIRPIHIREVNLLYSVYGFKY